MKKILFAIAIATSLLACTNYGKKVSKDYLEVYYKDGATEQEAQKTLDFLYPLWKDESGKTETKSVQLTKSGDTVNFRVVVDEKKLKEMGDATFYAMGTLFSDSLFNGAPVNMVFSDNSFKPIRTLVFKKTDPIPDFGPKVTAGNIEVYSKDGFSREQAQMLADYLQEQISPAQTISFQVGNTDDGGYLVRMVSDESKVAAMGDASFNAMAEEIATNFFKGGQLTFELTDGKFVPFKKFLTGKANTVDTTAVQ